MTNLRSLNRRLDRLDGDGGTSIAKSLATARLRHKEQQFAWTAAGNSGSPPLGPLYAPGPGASRRGRELWRRLAHGRARVLHMGHETDGTSPFKSLGEAYGLSDEALLTAINGHPSAAEW